MSTVPADVELHPIEGESLTMGDQTAMFHLVVVAIDPYTHESAWLLETAGRILTAFHGADCRVAWLVRAPAQDAVTFLGPWAEQVLTFADPDGTAIEASMTPTMQFILHKGAGKTMAWPRGEDANYYYTMGMDEDLDNAMKHAVTETVKFLETRGLSTADAYALASIGVDFIVGEAVDGVLLIYAAIPKSLFKTKTPYWTAAR